MPRRQERLRCRCREETGGVASALFAAKARAVAIDTATTAFAPRRAKVPVPSRSDRALSTSEMLDQDRFRIRGVVSRGCP
jgi:hypothetical protein